MSDAMIDRIRTRLAELGLTARAASLAYDPGKPDLIRQLTRKGGPDHPRVDTLSAVAAALGVSESWLLYGTEAQASPAERSATEPSAVEPPQPATSPAIRRRMTPVPTARDRVPVLGTAGGAVLKSGMIGFTMGSAVEQVESPPALRTARGLYALYVAGDSMRPKHEHGELRFVHPHRPAKPGDSVIVRTAHHEDDPGQLYIKILLERSGEWVRLQQLNRPAEIAIPTRYVMHIHRVLTTNELFGV